MRHFPALVFSVWVFASSLRLYEVPALTEV